MTDDFPEEFRLKLKRHEELLASEAFYVLVWGSGSASGTDYAKRIKIREELAGTFGENNVFISEDERFNSLVAAHGLRTAEAIQAGSVDGVVILDTSIGPHSEIHEYSDIIASKAIVFVKHEHKNSDSFASVAYHALKTEGYSDDEYACCSTIRRKALAFLSARRLRKARLKDLQGLFGA